MNFEAEQKGDFDDILVKFAEKKSITNPFIQESWSPVSAIKTHFPLPAEKERDFEREKISKITRAIHIIRSPFDSLLAKFSSDYPAKATAPSKDTEGLLIIPPQSSFDKHWDDFIKTNAKQWKHEMEYWVPEKIWNNKTIFKKTTAGVHYFVVNRTITINEQSKHVEVLNLFYEDFAFNFANTAKVLFEYLKDHLGDIMPSVRNAIICSLYLERRLEDLKQSNGRKDKFPDEIKINPFAENQEMVEDIDNSTNTKSFRIQVSPATITQELCQLYSGYWFPMKWGNCLKGSIQLFQTKSKLKRKNEVDKLGIGKVYRSKHVLNLGFCDN